MDTTGIILAIASALAMGTIGVFSKMTGLPAEIITFFRLALGALFLLLYLLLTGQGRDARSRPTWPVLINGALLAGFILLYVQAMNLTSMAFAIMLVYLAPVAAAVVAHFFLRERLNRAGWLLLAVSLLGFAAIMEFSPNLTADADHAAGLLYATGAMACYAGFILVNRRIRADVPVMTRALYQLATGALVMLPFCLHTDTPAITPQIPWLIGTGLLPGFIAITCAVAALSRLPAATFGTLAYFEPLAVIVFGWSLFGETLSPLQITGCLMIMGSGCLKALTVKA